MPHTRIKKIPWLILVWTAGFCYGLSLSAAASSLKMGDEAFQKGAYSAATQIWQTLLHTAAEDKQQQFEVYLRLSEAYQIAGHQIPAATWAQHAVDAALTPAQQLRALSRRIDVHLALQHSSEAQELLTDLIPLIQSIKDPALRALGLNTQGNVLRFIEDYPNAAMAFQAAIQQAHLAGHQGLKVQALNNAADTALLQHNIPHTLDLLYWAWDEMPSLPLGHARLQEQLALGRLVLRLPSHAPQRLMLASEILSQAQTQLDLSEDSRLPSYLYAYLGQWYESAGGLEQALKLTEYARFLAQEDDALSYLWGWQRGRVLQAQGHIDAAADAYRKALMLLQPIRQALLNGRRNARQVFREEIRPVYYALADVLLQQAANATGTAQQEMLDEVRSVLEIMKAAELQDYFQDECVAQLRHRVAVSDRIPPHTAVFYPILLPDRTELLLQLADNHLYAMRVSFPGDQVNQLASELQAHLQAPRSWLFLDHAQTLHRLLFAPLYPLLKQHQVQTVVFVPDGALRMIPPAVLHHDKSYLIEDFALVTTPGLDITDLDRVALHSTQALLGGLSQAVQGFSALPGVQQEIERVGDLYEQHTSLLNKDFDLPAIRQTLQQQAYQVIHMASHGQFERDPEKSFILTYDGKLTMTRLETLLQSSSYQEGGIDLLTLSACQTAVGDDRAALGLAGVAVQSGARSALASLWSVNDEATAELVTEFYQQLQNPALNKAQALQGAQRALLAQPRFRHPSYWAAFMLIGNWL